MNKILSPTLESPAVYTSIVPPRSYACLDEAQFLHEYAADIANGTVHTFTELRLPDVIRLTIDIDIKTSEPPSNINRPISFQTASSIVESIYHAILATGLDLDMSAWVHRTGDIHSKPSYKIDGGWKYGLHIIFHGCFFPKSHLHPLKNNIIRNIRWFSENALDPNSFTCPWLLLGSSKHPEAVPYTPWHEFHIMHVVDKKTGVTNFNGIDWVLRSPSITHADIIRCSVRLPGKNTPVLSYVPDVGRYVYTHTPVRDRKPRTIRPYLVNVVNTIPASLAHSYSTWSQIVWAIKTETNGSEEGRLLAHAFSKQALDKYSEAAVDTLWNTMQPVGSKYTIGTLRYYARKR